MSTPPALPEPPLVPGYVLQVLLGRGGSGEVWRAVPRGGGAPVAVKVLVAGDAERQAREAALLGELDHPHLVRLRDVVHQPRRGETPRVALVLDLLAGGSLAGLLAARGRLRPGEVVTVVAPVAAALAHAHERGVIHGDLSPGNIVFTGEGRPVLTDLGVARVLGERESGEVTPAYVDPTVARGGAPGPASDVFGVAAAAFHALTGVPPWNAAGPAETLTVAARGALPDLDELAPGAPLELREVVRRGLAADPADRGSAAAFALDLRHACRPEPVRLPAPGLPVVDLARTGAAPRTELTHQVPGRRPRDVPDAVTGAPSPGARRHRRVRRAARGPLRALAVGVLAGGLAVAAWAGVRGFGGVAEAARPAPRAVAPSSPSPTAAPHPADGGAPSTPAGWRDVVAELYARRSASFTDPREDRLADVYTAGNALLAADEQYRTALDAAGTALRGFRPTVTAVLAARPSGLRVELRVTEARAAYDVVRADDVQGPAVGRQPEQPVREVELELLRTPAGWRIDSARRVG